MWATDAQFRSTIIRVCMALLSWLAAILIAWHAMHQHHPIKLSVKSFIDRQMYRSHRITPPHDLIRLDLYDYGKQIKIVLTNNSHDSSDSQDNRTLYTSSYLLLTYGRISGIWSGTTRYTSTSLVITVHNDLDDLGLSSNEIRRMFVNEYAEHGVVIDPESLKLGFGSIQESRQYIGILCNCIVILVVSAAIWLSSTAYKHWRAGYAVRSCRCPRCYYCLIGHKRSDTCPECGFSNAPAVGKDE